MDHIIYGKHGEPFVTVVCENRRYSLILDEFQIYTLEVARTSSDRMRALLLYLTRWNIPRLRATFLRSLRSCSKFRRASVLPVPILAVCIAAIQKLTLPLEPLSENQFSRRFNAVSKKVERDICRNLQFFRKNFDNKGIYRSKNNGNL